MSIKSALSRFVPGSIKKKIDLRKQERILHEGYETYLNTGKTPDESHMAIINLYCATNGRFNEAFHNKIKVNNPPASVDENISGVIGNYSSADFKRVNDELNKNGYADFSEKLSKDLCRKIYEYALTTPARIPPAYDEKIIYDPAKPLAEIYRFDVQDLMNNAEIRELIMDPALLNIARNYLECEPIFDFPAMWWSTAYKKEASSEAAQLYHFDMDRVKWLKIFFYINDVTDENGPHSYIRGTHQVNAKPEEILKRGYARIKDEELRPYYEVDDIKVVCGEAGSIFAGDTKCWHKGIPLKSGHRLVLELEYTDSLFGVNMSKLTVTNPDDKFKAFCESHKTVASNILLKNL